MKLHRKTVIVTGGGNGIGEGICLKMAKEGAKVVVADIDQDAAEKTVKKIMEFGGVAIPVETDVTQKKSADEMIKTTLNKFGTLDILVNNAGTDIKGAVEELQESTWDKLMVLNLKGVFLSTQAAVRVMKKRRYGRIVNISSIAGKTGEPYTSPYCTTKFGVIGFTQSIALELGIFNITINAVCPGPVETDLIKKSISQTAKLNNRTYDEELYEKFLRLTPLGRLGKPEDVANAVVFLASDEASFITGSSLNVSGGREMH
ncbi:MAG: SDR family oxidoreductase [Spirochaetia bacterium]|nr:SDR family oxidoreductase [Spirochaetia bacterium]